jgi:hypothetical protein
MNASIGGRSGSDITRMVWNMVKFVMLLTLLGLIVAPANGRIPKMGDNVTIVSELISLLAELSVVCLPTLFV